MKAIYYIMTSKHLASLEMRLRGTVWNRFQGALHRTRVASSFESSRPRRSFSDKIVDSPSIWDDPNDDFKKIFDNNRQWVDSKLSSNAEYFKKLSGGQSPTFLLVGCSDSRVGAQEIMGLEQGELFVHRNIANLVVTTDLNFLSVLFYSVNVLKVKEIIVLGHYACGGVRAASENKDLGLIEHWLKNIRDVQRLHADELSQITDPEKKHRRLVELNIQEQCFNLYGNSIVQQMQAKTGRPRIHGMVYDIADGKLHYLNIDFKSQIKKYRSIYAVADFRRYQPIDVREAVKHASEGKGTESKDDEKKAEQEKVIKLMFATIDTDRDGIISKEEIRLAMRQYVDSETSEKDIAHAMEPILVSTPNDELNYAQFHEIMDSLHSAGIKEKDDSDRLVVIRPSSGQVRITFLSWL